jgi:dienelactone hydrolase
MLSCNFHLVSSAAIVTLLTLPTLAHADEAKPSSARQVLQDYFQQETARLTAACLADVDSLADWEAQRGRLRQQLWFMLGLDPAPERTDLKAVVTGKLDHPQFTVEKLHFQSQPGLYVTGNLYLPKGLTAPAPTILYLCGHGQVKKDGISFGNKVHYQHHPAWFAQHGYVCLAIDTLQLGEIEGIHHGTYRQNMWWWNNRGYTPAGVEAWNCIRALDYLETRPEVDPRRIGATGRSGGGAYSWFVAALDDRIQVVVPVAGITDLHNHVVDGAIEGHCDCMFYVNSHRWDFGLLAALIAPRPLLISNTDKDSIFPLDGVLRIHRQVQRIYALHGATDKLGLHITEGPHQDTQELQVHAFVWFDRFLRGEPRLIHEPAEPCFQPAELRVFTELPADAVNARVQETFVPVATIPDVPSNNEDWQEMRDGWLDDLRTHTYAGWPQDPESLDLTEVGSAQHAGVQLTIHEFASQSPFRLRLYELSDVEAPETADATLQLVDQSQWLAALARLRVGFSTLLNHELSLTDELAPDPAGFEAWAKLLHDKPHRLILATPRGVGLSNWSHEDRSDVHLERRFTLLGQTSDGMRVWDVRRALQAVRERLPSDATITLAADGAMAGTALHAALFEPPVARLQLSRLAATHRQGPYLLHVQRFVEIPQLLSMANEHSSIQLIQPETSDAWKWSLSIADTFAWPRPEFKPADPSTAATPNSSPLPTSSIPAKGP